MILTLMLVQMLRQQTVLLKQLKQMQMQMQMKKQQQKLKPMQMTKQKRILLTLN
jgi:hypothetical protein